LRGKNSTTNSEQRKGVPAGQGQKSEGWEKQSQGWVVWGGVKLAGWFFLGGRGRDEERVVFWGSSPSGGGGLT